VHRHGKNKGTRGDEENAEESPQEKGAYRTEPPLIGMGKAKSESSYKMGSSGRNSQRKSVSVKKKTVKNFFAHPRSSGKNYEEANLPGSDGKKYRHISGDPPEKAFPPGRFPEPQSKPCHSSKSCKKP